MAGLAPCACKYRHLDKSCFFVKGCLGVHLMVLQGFSMSTEIGHVFQIDLAIVTLPNTQKPQSSRLLELPKTSTPISDTQEASVLPRVCPEHLAYSSARY